MYLLFYFLVEMESWVSGLNQFPAKEPLLREPKVRILHSPPKRAKYKFVSKCLV